MGTRCLGCGWWLVAVVAGSVAPRTQSWEWRVPPLGAVEYRRECTARASEAAPSAAAARSAALAGKNVEHFVHRIPPAPWMCDGELAPDRRSVDGPVRDLRDVARAIAFDLSSRSAIRGRFPRVVPLGDLVVSGSWSAPSADGTQTLRATLVARPPAAVAGEPKGTVERLRVFCVTGADGTVEMERRVDAAAGVVAKYSVRFDLVVREEDKKFRRVAVADEWTFVAVRDNQDADFRKRVAAAITEGVGFVREQVEGKKSFLVDAGGDERNYGSGRLALALLTLVHAHVAATDPVVIAGFDDLRRRRLEDSYSIATALMAMAARHAPPGEAERVRSDGNAPLPPPRNLDERDRKVAEKWTKQLLGNIDPRADPAKILRFNYTPGPRYDTSLQQYGLLGLWSALRLGIEVPNGAFAAAARQLLAVQCPPGDRLVLRRTTHAQLRDAAGTDAPPKAVEDRVAARGFSYQEPGEPPFGSMTSAGISGLLLARAGMVAQQDADRALLSQIDAGLAASFGWLATEFSVRSNPGFAERADNHWYYWLYGLERSCELASIAWLNGRDWYYEGALQLLSQQQANGSFRAEHPSSLLLDTTCFAILFLVKSTPAVITGG